MAAAIPERRVAEMHPDFDLIEPDDAVYAEYSANFVTYNAEAAGATAESFSLVHRKDDRIVAGGRGSVFLGALEVRGLWVDAALRGTGIGSRLLREIEADSPSGIFFTARAHRTGL